MASFSETIDVYVWIVYAIPNIPPCKIEKKNTKKTQNIQEKIIIKFAYTLKS